MASNRKKSREFELPQLLYLIFNYSKLNFIQLQKHNVSKRSHILNNNIEISKVFEHSVKDFSLDSNHGKFLQVSSNNFNIHEK